MEETLPKCAQTSEATPNANPEPQATRMLRPAVPLSLPWSPSSARRVVRGARTRGRGGTGGVLLSSVEGATEGTRTLGSDVVVDDVANEVEWTRIGSGWGAGSRSMTNVSSSLGRSAGSKCQGWRSTSIRLLLSFIMDPTAGSSSESMEGSKSSSWAAQSVSSSRQLGGATGCSSPFPRSRTAGTWPVGASFQCGMPGLSSTTGPVTSWIALPAGSAPMMRTRPER